MHQANLRIIEIKSDLKLKAKRIEMLKTNPNFYSSILCIIHSKDKDALIEAYETRVNIQSYNFTKQRKSEIEYLELELISMIPELTNYKIN